MNLLAFFLLLGGLLPLADRVASVPVANESKCSQQMIVGGEKMWITDVLANHNCQMGPLFTSAMGRGNPANVFEKFLSSSPLTRSVCAGMVGLLGVAEQKHMMDAMCSSLKKNWDVIFCKEYYSPGQSAEVLKSLANQQQSNFLPPEVQSVIDSLASMEQSSCSDACGGGKGFICKAFVSLAVALLNPSPSNEGVETPVRPDSVVEPSTDPGAGVPQTPGAGSNSPTSQKIPARYGTSFGDGKSDHKSEPENKDPKNFGFVDPSNPKENQPGPPVDPAIGRRPGAFPPKGFPGNGRQANSSLLRKLDPNTKRPFQNPDMLTPEGQPQTNLGQPQTGVGQPQTGFGQPQTSARQPQTGVQQPQGTGSQSVPGIGQPQTNPKQPQTNPEQPQTNPGQPQANPGQPQANPGQLQTDRDQQKDSKPSVEASTRTGPPKEAPKKDVGSDKLEANNDKKDEDKDGDKPPHDDDEEHELLDHADDDDDDDDYEEDKSPKEDLSRPQFQNVPPPAKNTPASKKEPIPPPPPPAGGKTQDKHPPDHLDSQHPRPKFGMMPHKVPPPVEIKSMDSAPVEEEYQGHGPFFFLTILCVVVVSGAMCYCCITNKMRVRETVHILLTSKGSKARREYR